MSVPLYENWNKLWEMSPDEFNDWRTNNDLPILFNYFKTKLPYFNEWMEDNQLRIDLLLKVVPTGALFKGNGERYIGSYQYYERIHTRVFTLQEIQRYGESIETKKFIPYLYWVKKRVKHRDFILSDKLNNTYTNTFVYNSWVSQKGLSRTHLFDDFKVLKLGQVTLQSGIMVTGKNLDFVDMDFLTIVGEHHGSYATKIYFSSCRNLRLENTMLHHIDFDECVLSDIVCVNSELQFVRFLQVVSAKFINSKLRNVSITGDIDFENTQLYEFDYYIPQIEGIYDRCHKEVFYQRILHRLRKVRVAFQTIGQIDKAQEYYYLEKCFERKSLYNPYTIHSDLFPEKNYAGGSLRQVLYHRFKENSYLKERFFKEFINAVVFHLKVRLLPKYIIRSFRFKIQWLTSLINYLLWGYGEKPVRILINAMVSVSIFALIFFNSGQPELNKSLVNSFYFSVITFTTLGYGDIHPGSSILKVICSTEALTGAFFIGLIVAGFSNKTRY